MNTMAILLSDTYKQIHNKIYPKGLTKLVSYWTPRRSMLKNQNKMVFFGLQAFIEEYLIDYFNKNFFELTAAEVEHTYKYSMDIQLGNSYDLEPIIKLHKLGYLPIQICAIPEGTLVPMGIPCIEITNTHPDFAWVVQWIECILQVELWKPCAHATIGHMYRELANDYYKMTCDDLLRPEMACSDFGMRGMSCMEEAVRCSSAWLLSFDKTSTIPAIDYIDTYYDACCWTERIGIGAVSTEHSVMASNYAVDGDEITFVKRLLTELYPNASFSMVSDTYDYWNMIDNILPACKKEIMQHNGKLLVRPDSGDMVEIAVETIEKLWNTFGGTVNSKGYDFVSPLTFTLKPGETIKIPTGIRCEMNIDWVLMLYPRSGLGCKYGLNLMNQTGIVDSDFYYSDNEGHIFVKLKNNGDKECTIREGDNVVQGVFLEYGITIDDEVTGIRNGGFGSTTKNK